ncbi:MAG: hypothetical protein K0R90_913 [Oscillospiraceae bacterium]|nr:hypothetical protein [Oscillospiraceae bacterium]
MHRKLFENFLESAKSVLPISIIVLSLHFTIAPMSLGTLALFITGMILLVAGMSLFTLGSDMAMMPMGEAVGSELTKSRKLWLLIIGCFVMGILVTIAEPDLQVLTKQVPSVPDAALVLSVAFGVGIFLVLAILRVLFQFKLSHMFVVLYALVFIIAAFTAPDYLAVSFDSGGVTTGPITVPFILALGAGVSAVRGSKSAEQDSFGLCALCSIGPVMAVLVMGMFYDPSNSGFAYETADTVHSMQELLSLYSNGFVSFFREVLTALLPVVIIFGLFQIIKLKLPIRQVFKIAAGILYTIIGLTIFLAGVNIGFMPAGNFLGSSIASSYKWILVPLSILIGFFIVAAEPAVHVLNKQVEEITSGAISKKMMMMGLSAGVGIALALAMVRLMTGISIWFFLIPGYAIALILTFFVSDIFTAIAFDSGGVAAGTMAAAFLLPFAMGACNSLGGNPITDAFGIIAMVAMMPLITLQVIGLIYRIKMSRVKDIDAVEETTAELECDVIPEYDDTEMIDMQEDETESQTDNNNDKIESSEKEGENAER